MRRFALPTVLVALVAALVLAVPALAAPKDNIVVTAGKAGQFKTLTALLAQAKLVGVLRSGSYTVFAPTDAAFAKVPKATLKKVAADPALLKQVLLYHVVKGKVPASTVLTLDGKSAQTLAGSKVNVTIRGNRVLLNGTARVTKTDVMASNGVIHVINRVLLPPAS